MGVRQHDVIGYPSGAAGFNGVRLPVVSEGEFVPPGTAVQVVTVQGNRIVVRAE